jgi:hypothetical protein
MADLIMEGLDLTTILGAVRMKKHLDFNVEHREVSDVRRGVP